MWEPQPPNPQPASRLFTSPLEIRRAIYIHLINTAGIHVVRTEQGILRLSACVGPDLYAGHTGDERDTPCRTRRGRRLASSWGPHWECEESVLRTMGELEGIADDDGESQTQATWRTNAAILRVCKRM